MIASELLELLEKGPTYELHANDCESLRHGTCDCFGPGLLKRIKEILKVDSVMEVIKNA